MEDPMSHQQDERWSRREFLGGMALAGTAGLLGLQAEPAAAEPPPETTKIVLRRPPGPGGACIAPQWVAEELLRGEGFTDVQYPRKGRVGSLRALAAGEVRTESGV